jgi:peptidoglycan/LPS O-acetylase OafA/YrhL
MMKLNYNLRQWPRFMLKRFVRLEPPYLLSILVAVAYFYARRFVPSSADVDLLPSTKNLLLHVGYLIPFYKGETWLLGTYWTLAIEFQYYLLLSLIFPLLKGGLGSRSIFYVIFLCLPFLNTDEFFLPRHTPIFMIGISYWMLVSGNIRLPEYWSVNIVCIVIASLTLPPPNIVAGLLTLIVIYHWPNHQNRLLLFLGKISYSLYLLHLAVGAGIVNLMSHHFKASYQKPIVIIVGYLASVAAAYAFYLVIERPSLRWSKRLGKAGSGKEEQLSPYPVTQVAKPAAFER